MNFFKKFGQSSCSTPSDAFGEPQIPVEYYNDEDYLIYVEQLIDSNNIDDFRKSFRRLDGCLTIALERKSYDFVSYLVTVRRFNFLVKFSNEMMIKSLFSFPCKSKIDEENEKKIMFLFFAWMKLHKDHINEEQKLEVTRMLNTLDKPEIQRLYLLSYPQLKRELEEQRDIKNMEFLANILMKRYIEVKEHIRKNIENEKEIMTTGFKYALELELYNMLLVFLFFGLKPPVRQQVANPGPNDQIDNPVLPDDLVILDSIDNDDIRDLLHPEKDRMEVMQEYIERIELNPLMNIHEKATDLISKEKDRHIRRLEEENHKLRNKKGGGENDENAISVSNYIKSHKKGRSMKFPKSLLPRMKFQLVQAEFEEMVRMSLSLLYWSKHLLDFQDHIELNSPFYDPGGSRKFRSLERFLSLPYKKKKGKGSREVILIDAKKDSRLKEVVKEVEVVFESGIKHTIKQKYEIIMGVVSKFFGGDDGRKVEKKCIKQLDKMMRKSGKMVVLLGDIRFGVCRHRSLLFKFLCDQFSLPCRLIRGFMGSTDDEEKHAWCMVFLDKQFFMADVMNSMSLVGQIDIDMYRRLGKGGAGGYSVLGYEVNLREKFIKKLRQLDNTDRGKVNLVRVSSIKIEKKKKLGKSSSRKKKIEEEEEEEEIEGEGENQKNKKRKKKKKNDDDDEKEEGKEMAMKVIPIKDSEMKSGLEKELLIMKFLNHENIMKCRYDFSAQSKKNPKISKLKILMDYMEYNGNQLLKLLKNADCTHERKTIETIILLLSVAKGIRYLHKCNIVLQSLELKNILINWNTKKSYIEDVKIAKFSAAGLLRSKRRNFTMKPDPESVKLRAVDVKKFGEIIGFFKEYLKNYPQMNDLRKDCKKGIISFDMIVYKLTHHLQMIYHLKNL